MFAEACFSPLSRRPIFCASSRARSTICAGAGKGRPSVVTADASSIIATSSSHGRSSDAPAWRRCVARRREVTLALLWLALLACARPPGPRLFWNASASVPIGLYVRMPGPPRVGALALARLPAPYRALADARGYLPAGVPLLKEVAGGDGDRVCRHGPVVTLNGRVRAFARARDWQRRSLPAWRGCRRLRRGEVVLLSPARDSFDSRYFGPLAAALLDGTAVALLTR